MLKKKNVNAKVVVAFDVDGTLITFDDEPRYDIIKILHDYAAMGCHVIIHSGGGQDYATRWADRLGIDCAQCYAKGEHNHDIDISYDDEVVNFGKINIQV